MTEFLNRNLFDSKGTLAEELIASRDYPWELLPLIGDFVAELAERLCRTPGWKMLSPGVAAAEDAVIAESAVICGPSVIGPGTEVRPGAYIRGKVLVCGGCVVGNSTELKNAVLLNGAKLPHYTYAGDSIVGNRAHMGAGAVASNLKFNGTNVVIRNGKTGECIDTGLRKVGAILADGADIGCHCVLNPGTVIGRNTVLYPNLCFRGTAPENSIVKSPDNIVPRN